MIDQSPLRRGSASPLAAPAALLVSAALQALDAPRAQHGARAERWRLRAETLREHCWSPSFPWSSSVQWRAPALQSHAEASPPPAERMAQSPQSPQSPQGQCPSSHHRRARWCQPHRRWPCLPLPRRRRLRAWQRTVCSLEAVIWTAMPGGGLQSVDEPRRNSTKPGGGLQSVGRTRPRGPRALDRCDRGRCAPPASCLLAAAAAPSKANGG